MFDLLIQAILLTAANYLLVLYLTDITVDGPFDIFNWVRARVGIRLNYVYDLDADTQELVDSEHDGQFLARVLSCHRCTSPYTAAGLILLSYLLGFLSPSWADVVLWLAVTGTTIRLFE